MSLLDKSSLVITPNATKASKLYSVIPSDGSGDMTVVRATTATRVNSNGLIESVALNVPRIDYTDSTCPSVLVEPQRTNLALYSEQFDNSYWGKLNITLTPNQITAPDGTNTADKLTDNAVSGSHYISSAVISIINSTSYTLTTYLKANTLYWVRLELFSGGCFFNLSNGTLGTSSGVTANILDVGNGWYRCSISATSSSTSAYPAIRITTGDGVFGYIGSGSSLYAWGAQLEAGSYPTSYIPTVASAVTRNADVISKTGISDLIGQTEGTVFVDFKIDGSRSSSVILWLTDGSSSNSVIAQYTSGGVLQIVLNSGGATQVNIVGSASVQGLYKLAIAYKLNDVAVYLNGVSVGVDTSATMPLSMSRIDIGQSSNLTSQLGGYINSAQLYKTRLTNAELATLTTL